MQMQHTEVPRGLRADSPLFLLIICHWRRVSVEGGNASLALSSATSIGPIASKIPEMSWLRAATDLVEQQLEKMAAEK
jgi:hypothetical protein